MVPNCYVNICLTICGLIVAIVGYKRYKKVYGGSDIKDILGLDIITLFTGGIITVAAWLLIQTIIDYWL